MKLYISQDNTVLLFRQSNMPRMLFVLLGQLGVYITLTGSKRYPYSVNMSESDFLATIQLAKEL